MDYPVAYLACRSDGHAWDPKNLVIVARNTLERHLWCAKHGGWRIDQVDRETGYVVHRRYVAPKDYYTRGLGRVGAVVFRKLLVEREWNNARIEGKEAS